MRKVATLGTHRVDSDQKTSFSKLVQREEKTKYR